MKDLWLRITTTFKKFIEFVRDVRKELNNVSWPARRELTGTTIVVIVAVFFFGFFLYVVDMFVNLGVTYVFQRVSH